jgi:hypothetical protein
MDHEHEHPSRWAAIMSIAGKIGCAILNEIETPARHRIGMVVCCGA